MITLENEAMSLVICRNSGAIRRLRDIKRGLDFIVDVAHLVPFRIEFADGRVYDTFQSFAWAVDPAPEDGASWQRLQLNWQVKPGLQITASIELPDSEEEVRFRCEVINRTDKSVVSVEYPIVRNLGSITEDGEEDYIAHSFATGLRVRNPQKHFTQAEPGFRYMPYPEGFSGATMQFFAYYGMHRGGLYFAALDDQGYSKWLNFYKNEGDRLEASFIHACEDIRPYSGIRPPYPMVIRLLAGDDWYEAAEVYKAWAMRQPWCVGGRKADADKDAKALWLLEEAGAATFGINAGHDRSPWLKKYRETIGTPLFHILGPDWVNTRQNFYNGIPGGMEDWFPTRFHENNLRTIRENGDRFAPFEFDYLFNMDGADGDKGRAARQLFPEPENMKSIDSYKFPFICPAAPYTAQLHIRRDERLQEEVNVDAIYYDISANNILKVCHDADHGHPVGAGQKIAQAYRDNYIRTKEAMIRAAGRYIPMGTEMINEIYLDVLDYYQARAGAQPAAPLEGWPIRKLLKSGDAELIPMFTYVYHEYGALRIDGWGKLAEEIGTLFYFTVARTYLWGGLYELNYEYSPMEAIFEAGEGDREAENAPDEHYYVFEPRGYRFSPDRARYLGQYAKLRTGAANPYLAYGTMLRPLSFSCDTIELDWFHYNCTTTFPEYNDSGKLKTDAIVHSAWQYRDESIALFFANVTEIDRHISVRIDPKQFTVRFKQIHFHGIEEKDILEPMDAGETFDPADLEFTVSGYGIVWLELK